MSTALTVIGLSLLVAVFAITVKGKNAEISFLAAVGFAAVALVYIISEISPAVKSVTEHFLQTGGNIAYLKNALKIAVIGYLTEISSDVCRDYGQSAIGKIAELGGKCVVFILLVPMFSDLLGIALEFLKL